MYYKLECHYSCFNCIGFTKSKCTSCPLPFNVSHRLSQITDISIGGECICAPGYADNFV